MPAASDTIDAIYKDPNQAKHTPIFPGYHGKQIRIMAYISDGSETVYTVPADNTLLLLNWNLQAFNSAATFEKAYCTMRDSTNTTRYRFFYSDDIGQGTLALTQSYTIPFEMETGDKILILSGHATLSIWVGFFGILVPTDEWR